MLHYHFGVTKLVIWVLVVLTVNRLFGSEFLNRENRISLLFEFWVYPKFGLIRNLGNSISPDCNLAVTCKPGQPYNLTNKVLSNTVGGVGCWFELENCAQGTAAIANVYFTISFSNLWLEDG